MSSRGAFFGRIDYPRFQKKKKKKKKGSRDSGFRGSKGFKTCRDIFLIA